MASERAEKVLGMVAGDRLAHLAATVREALREIEDLLRDPEVVKARVPTDGETAMDVLEEGARLAGFSSFRQLLVFAGGEHGFISRMFESGCQADKLKALFPGAARGADLQ